LLHIAPAAATATGKQTMMNKYTYFAGCFDGHGHAPVHDRAYCLMEEVQDFTRSHWMPPSGKYYVREHKRDMATPFFFGFSSSTNRKRLRVASKAHVFNKSMTYQTKEKGLAKVSLRIRQNIHENKR
jgi:hypothetical protein